MTACTKKSAYVSLSFHSAYSGVDSYPTQSFVRILIEKSDLDRMVPFKYQRGDEMHKIFTVVRLVLLSPHLCSSHLFDLTPIGCRGIPSSEQLRT